jgi:glycosyltransferase involved in cell wall biosynthesis
MPAQSQPLVSVVTPVYNAEKYLNECIESVLAQTYQNWEYVIVNNCSADGSLEIAQGYARQDARIRVHDNDRFLNQMQNWNHAMRQISPASKYCKVVHADDWLFPECIRLMVRVAEANPSVDIVGAYRLDEDRINLDGLPYPSTVVPGREVCRLTLLGSLYVFGSPTSLLIRSDRIRNRDAFYDEHIVQADKKVCFEILQDADFGFVHQVLTYTRRHNESITSLILDRFHTRRMGRLIYLQKYGPVFLTGAEFEGRLGHEMESYYRFLGRSLFDLRDRTFWVYHKNELQSLGHRLSWARLAKSAFLELLNLRDTLSRTRYALRRKKGHPAAQEVERQDTGLSSVYTKEKEPFP